MADEQFKVESDIPVPSDANTGVRKYPFKTMNVGDSFAFSSNQLTAVRNAAFSFAKRHGGKFIFRCVATDVWRCWKIERGVD